MHAASFFMSISPLVVVFLLGLCNTRLAVAGASSTSAEVLTPIRAPLGGPVDNDKRVLHDGWKDDDQAGNDDNNSSSNDDNNNDNGDDDSSSSGSDDDGGASSQGNDGSSSSQYPGVVDPYPLEVGRGCCSGPSNLGIMVATSWTFVGVLTNALLR